MHLLNGVADVRKWHKQHGSVLIVSYEKLTEIMKQKTKRGQKGAAKRGRPPKKPVTFEVKAVRISNPWCSMPCTQLGHHA